MDWKHFGLLLPEQTFPQSSIMHTFEFGPGDVPEVCRTNGAFSCDCGSSPLRLPDLDKSRQD
jgi:hypothetical protein